MFPLGLDPTFLLKLVQRRIKGPFTYLQHVTGHLSQPSIDSPPMQRLKRQDLQQQQIERSLNKIGRFAHNASLGYREQNTPTPLGKQGVIREGLQEKS